MIAIISEFDADRPGIITERMCWSLCPWPDWWWPLCPAPWWSWVTLSRGSHTPPATRPPASSPSCHGTKTLSTISSSVTPSGQLGNYVDTSIGSHWKIFIFWLTWYFSKCLFIRWVGTKFKIPALWNSTKIAKPIRHKMTFTHPKDTNITFSLPAILFTSLTKVVKTQK